MCALRQTPPASPFPVTIRFYGQLNDFLPRSVRGCRLKRLLNGAASVRDTIGACGVPPPEVDLVLVNGTPVDFAHRLAPDDHVTVYPLFRHLDLTGVLRVGSTPPRPVRFVADVHLGRLAAFLRLAGADTIVLGNDAAIAAAAARDDRVVLTRDVDLLKRAMVRHGHWVRSTDPERQLAEVASRFDLADDLHPFSRCLVCNTPLAAMDAASAADRVPPRVRDGFSRFQECPGCGRVYWEGSHYARLAAVVGRLRTPPT